MSIDKLNSAEYDFRGTALYRQAYEDKHIHTITHEHTLLGIFILSFKASIGGNKIRTYASSLFLGNYSKVLKVSRKQRISS